MGILIKSCIKSAFVGENIKRKNGVKIIIRDNFCKIPLLFNITHLNKKFHYDIMFVKELTILKSYTPFFRRNLYEKYVVREGNSCD